MIAQSNMIVTANPSFSANTMAEAVDFAKHNPNAVKISISPIGTPNHLGAELLMQLGGINLTIIPYTGVSAAILT